MKICYVDESGNENDPCLVMVGILIDAHRLHKTRSEFGESFATIQSLFDADLREIKGSKLVQGRDRWRAVDPDI